MLFSGRLRENLDPFDEYADRELWTALDQVSLTFPPTWSLSLYLDVSL